MAIKVIKEAELPSGVLRTEEGFVIGTTDEAVSVIEDAKRSGIYDERRFDIVFREPPEGFKLGKGTVIKRGNNPFIVASPIRSAPGKVRLKGFDNINNCLSSKTVDDIPDKTVSVNLRDLVPLVQRSDLTEPDGVEQFCKDALALGRKPAKTKQHSQPRLSDSEKALVEELKAKNLPRWAERNQRDDELTNLPAPFYFARVYSAHMGKITRKVLKEVDPELTGGITNYQRDHGGSLPEGVELPNERTTSRQWVEQFKAGKQGEENDPATLSRNGQRLRRTASRERQ